MARTFLICCLVLTAVATVLRVQMQWEPPRTPRIRPQPDVAGLGSPPQTLPPRAREHLPDGAAALGVSPRRRLPPLQAKLFGTVMGDTPADARAYFHDRFYSQRRILKLGEMLEGRLLNHIGRGFVRFRRPDGSEETVFIEDSGHHDAIVQAVGPDMYRVDKPRLVEAVQGDVNRLLSQVKIQPHLEGFRLTGFELADIQSEGLAAQVGLQPKDVITAVNGTPLNSVQAAFELYQASRATDAISVQVMRSGDLRTLRYVLG